MFANGLNLLQHLRAEHFSNILHVPMRDWDLYMRTCEGKSGATGKWVGFWRIIRLMEDQIAWQCLRDLRRLLSVMHSCRARWENVLNALRPLA